MSVHMIKIHTILTNHLPEKGSDHVCSLPPYLLPCTEEHGRSFPDHSEREIDQSFRKDSINNYGNNSFI